MAILDVAVHPDWVGRPLRSLEEATGTRVAYLVRFGTGLLPTASTAVQDGDRVYFLVTDEIADTVAAVAGAAPKGA